MTENTSAAAYKRVFLVDGHSYLYRAFYATPHLSNSRGVPTNAIYAFVGMIRKLIASENPDNLIVVFDARGPSFREEISREYKAQRPAMPDNLSLQVPFVKEIIDAMGLPVVEKEGFEADDIIATITEHLKTRDNVMTFIVTGDKDMMQLVGDRVRILDSMKNVVIGEAEVIEKFGVPPRNIVDYLSLCGDTSDNIPGVPGIGEKTARELVSSLGSVENIYARVDEMKRKAVRERLIAGREKAEMSKKLATLRYDVPIEAGVEGLAARPPDLETLRKLYRELEFTALYREVRVQGKEKKDVKEKALADLATDRVSIAGSFRGKNAGDLELLAFSAFDGEGVFLSDDVADLAVVLRNAKEVIGHDLKAFFVVAGDLLQEKKVFDTMLAAYLANPLRKDLAPGPIVEEYLDADISAADAASSLRGLAACLPDLADALRARLHELELSDLFFGTELPLVAVLADMEKAGVRIDRRKLGELSRDLDHRLTEIVKDIYAHSGEPFNINSPQQLSRVLFEVLGLTPVKKTKTGFSTDTSVLEALSGSHPLPGRILEYRTLAKLKNTYVDVLPTLISPRTGRIPPSTRWSPPRDGFRAATPISRTSTGQEGPRSANPSCQDGCASVLGLLADRASRLAHLSGDEDPSPFHRDEDIHSTVARTSSRDHRP